MEEKGEYAMLDSQGIAVQNGYLCAQPLVNRLGYDSVIRVSPAFYHTEQDAGAYIGTKAHHSAAERGEGMTLSENQNAMIAEIDGLGLL